MRRVAAYLLEVLEPHEQPEYFLGGSDRRGLAADVIERVVVLVRVDGVRGPAGHEPEEARELDDQNEHEEDHLKEERAVLGEAPPEVERGVVRADPRENEADQEVDDVDEERSSQPPATPTPGVHVATSSWVCEICSVLPGQCTPSAPGTSVGSLDSLPWESPRCLPGSPRRGMRSCRLRMSSRRLPDASLRPR